MVQNLHICICLDDGYVKYAAVLINSIVINAEKANKSSKVSYKFVFHLISNHITGENIKKISSLENALTVHFETDILVHTVDDTIFRKYRAWSLEGNNSYATYLRLLIPEILDESVNKCVYLDCDMLCCGNIIELFNIDLGDAIIGASVDAIALMSCLEFKGKKLGGGGF